MKHIIILIFCLANLHLFAQKDELKIQVKEANELYINQKFEQAIEKYMKVVKSGYESPELYYNIGNAYYKSNKIPFAILYYEKAKLLDPKNPKIEHNLKLAQNLVADKIDEIPEFAVSAVITRIINTRSAKNWAYINIICFILSLGAALFYLFNQQRRIRLISFWTGLILLISSGITGWFAFEKQSMVTKHDTAIIIVPAITIKSSPDENSTELFRLREGVKVTVQDVSGEWREIKLSDGRVGWLPFSSIEII